MTDRIDAFSAALDRAAILAFALETGLSFVSFAAIDGDDPFEMDLLPEDAAKLQQDFPEFVLSIRAYGEDGSLGE
jgi:hypothetical protein